MAKKLNFNSEQSALSEISETSSELSEDGARARHLQEAAWNAPKESGTESKRFEELRKRNKLVSESIAIALEEVIQKHERAFYMQQYEISVLNKLEAHDLYDKSLREEHERQLQARDELSNSKKESRKNYRANKRRDMIIERQAKLSHATLRLKDAILEKRNAFDTMVVHMNLIHEKQRDNLVSSQERSHQHEKALVALETKGMQLETRATHLKKFQVRVNHQSHLYKRINDNIRDFQAMERLHSKEAFELDLLAMEDIENKKIAHETMRGELKLEHFIQMGKAKEYVAVKKEKMKKKVLTENLKAEMHQLHQEQRVDIRKMKLRHEEKVASGRFGASGKTSLMGSSKGAGSHKNSRGGSRGPSKGTSRASSKRISEDIASESIKDGASATTGDSKIRSRIDEESIMSDGNRKISGTGGRVYTEDMIAELQEQQRQDWNVLVSDLNRDLNDTIIYYEAKKEELYQLHSATKANLYSEQETQLADMREIQEKEIIYEETMHENEMKTLIERRILNSVLNTVADGIISITSSGIITRFNKAAEDQFGYTAEEALGRNVKFIMPSMHAKKHDHYLSNYMATGIKKVIGIGRKVYGRRKDGTEFPVHLSVGEVKEFGEHMFTGFIHDMTQEEDLKAAHQARIEAKNKELKEVFEELELENARISSLLSRMLPPIVSQQLMASKSVEPETFESVTMLYFDIVGFTKISSMVPPLEIVDLLNCLYGSIDNIIEKFDAYKVETVGDCYLIASGVPRRNRSHAVEIANLALQLVKTVSEFRYEPAPHIKINIRVGIHSGMVVGGVVGVKMPRYCLFGENVLITNKMEQTSEAGRIQISEETYKHLNKESQFKVEPRGHTEMLSRKIRTFWLNSTLQPTTKVSQ